MDYLVKTPQQLRPLLVGFRKEAGLTQAQLAARLGIAQQTYAQLEAKPESASLDRLYVVLKLLNVSFVLTHASGPERLDDRVMNRDGNRDESAKKPARAKRPASTKSGIKSGSSGAAKTRTQRATNQAKTTTKDRSSKPLPIASVIKKREEW